MFRLVVRQAHLRYPPSAARGLKRKADPASVLMAVELQSWLAMRCRWDAPDGTRSVHLSCATVDGLRRRVIEAWMTPPRRGTEIGGLLLGRFPPAEPGGLQVEAFEEVPCEHRYGPLYILSADDRNCLAEAVRRHRPEGSPMVVGFFHSFSHRDPMLSAAEVELLRTYIPNERCGILLLQPQSYVDCQAAFLFHQDGQLRGVSPYPSFSFDSAALEETTDRDVSRTPWSAGAPPVAPAAVLSVVPAPTTLIAAAQRIAAETAPSVSTEASPPVAAEGPQPLASFAQLSQPRSREDDPLARVRRVWLSMLARGRGRWRSVARGREWSSWLARGRERLRSLDRGRTRPPLPDRGRGQSPSPARGSVWLPLLGCMVLGVATASIYQLWEMAREPRWTDLKLDASPMAGQLQLRWDHASPAVKLASRGALSVTDGASRKTIQLSGDELRAGRFAYKPSHADVLFRLEVYGSGIQSSGDSLRVMNVPHSTTPRVAPAPIHPRTVSAAPSPAAPSPAAPSPDASPGVPVAETPAQPGIGEASRSQPPPAHDAAAEPARVLQEVQPEISEGIRSRIENRLVVPVEVYVSETGTVTEAVSQGKGDAVYRYLAEEAAKAARSWRFSPAKSKSGTPVASRKRLEFVFTPPSGQ